MEKIQSLKNVLAEQPQTSTDKEYKSAVHASFKAQAPDTFVRQSSLDEQRMRAMEQREKEIKKQKNKNNLMTTITALSGIAIIAMVASQFGLFGKAASKGMQQELGIKDPKELLKTFFKDTSKSRSLEDLHMADNLNKLTNDIIHGIENIGEATRKGGQALRTIFLYGPPGTGKTTFAESIAKKLNAEFYNVQMSHLNSPLHGVTEQNIKTAFDAICKQADELLAKGDNKKIVVFLDEIDSVMMVDSGNGGKLSNDILNQFKLCFNDLLKRKNITVIGATNLEIDAAKSINGKYLDEAMLSRFKEKVLVDFPTKQQLIDTVVHHYKNADLVADGLKDKSSGILDKIFGILTERYPNDFKVPYLQNKSMHECSFRTLESIFDKAYLSTGSGEVVSTNHFINSIIGKAEELKLTEADIDKLKGLLTP